jgi:tetratricopeptide (TPR) repeat protein
MIEAIRKISSAISVVFFWATLAFIAVCLVGMLTGCASMPDMPDMRPFTSETGGVIERAAELRKADRKAEAVALLEQTAMARPDAIPVRVALGKALADDNQCARALDVLDAANDPAAPNVSVLSAEGVCLDMLGRHEAAASQYAAALKIEPGNAMITANVEAQRKMVAEEVRIAALQGPSKNKMTAARSVPKKVSQRASEAPRAFKIEPKAVSAPQTPAPSFEARWRLL